ncbi:hypothetical protein HF521_015747 [Silurus meridionalis]|uniref:XK-related protein n=1 Tax=Silurus meridionalis TaxID=175797 RepID=A0A8T0A3S1_SILME|nr:hypothetical protein HF521_015747 [Silurus meridionalis]
MVLRKEGGLLANSRILQLLLFCASGWVWFQKENVRAYAMEEGFPFHFLWSDVIFSVLSLLLFLVDIALDVWAIVSLYEEQKYFSMGLLICILLSSSVLLQIFSWLWYTDSSKNLETNVEKFISRHGLMNIVHIFQLGVFVRFAAVMEISITSIKHGELLKEGIAVYLNHDLSMLRLFEAFSENSPQLILMMALIIEMPELHFFTDVTFSVLSLFLFLVDIALDVWAIVSLYEEQKYFSMGLLICILLSSSVLLQIFSWLWYTDSSKNLETNVEKFISRHGLMNIVHIFQLGVFVRFAAVMEISITSIKQGELLKEGIAVYLNHDLSMLRLFEAFSESSPQLILMMALIIEMPELHFFTVIKILASLSSLSFTVLSFHRNMRALVPQKFRMGWTSSVIYFLWNLLLIGPRVVCVSLFASVLPCYIAAHFLSLWMLLFLWAWWQNTDFMDSKSGEWLYRATVALICYTSEIRNHSIE